MGKCLKMTKFLKMNKMSRTIFCKTKKSKKNTLKISYKRLFKFIYKDNVEVKCNFNILK